MMIDEVGTIRPTLRPTDIPELRALAAQTRVFSQDELAFICEIGEEILARGPGSGYRILVAENGAQILGFTIFGPIGGTDRRHELYWIATLPSAQRSGIASALMRETIAQVMADGGSHLFIETSTRPDYAPAHAFYRKHGFAQLAEVPDYHADGDGKAVFGRRL